MDYILSGDPLHVEHILQENARRVAMGWVKFTPATPDSAVHYLPEDSKTVTYVDSKTVAAPVEKVTATKRTTKKTTEKE